jgi:hypothetical protein
VIAAMSAPLKFVAGATTKDVTITPAVTVRKVWDGRWLNGFLAWLTMAVLERLVDRRLKRASVAT